MASDRAQQRLICKECFFYYLCNADGTPSGRWDNARQSILSNGNFSRIGRSAGLEACANKNRANPGALSDAQVATLVEAILGAVFEDAGYQYLPVEAVMQELGLTYVVTFKPPPIRCSRLYVYN